MPPGEDRVTPMTAARCSFAGCDHVAWSRGWCSTHYTRWLKYGDASIVNRAAMPPVVTGDDHPNWVGDRATYQGVHSRLRRERGRASLLVCGCGSPARHWAYNHSGERERQSRFGPYSTDLDQYEALCVSCHKLADLARLAVSA